MGHNRLPRGTVPMRLARRHMHHITNPEPLGLLAFRAHKACAHSDSQDLAALMRVPESACAGREADVVAHAVVGREDRVHVYSACESFRGLL